MGSLYCCIPYSWQTVCFIAQGSQRAVVGRAEISQVSHHVMETYLDTQKSLHLNLPSVDI